MTPDKQNFRLSPRPPTWLGAFLVANYGLEFEDSIKSVILGLIK